MSFGSGVWGGGGSGSGSAGVALSTLLAPALRKAGIKKLPGGDPSGDATSELIPELNRMMASFNLDGHKVNVIAIIEYAMTAGQKIYTIGPGGDLAGVRPNYIKTANIIFPTDPQVRQQVYVTSDARDWASLQVQDIPGAPSWALYYDQGYDANGLGKIYVYPQPPADYILELYQWIRFTTTFSGLDDLVVLPDGYEEVIVNNLAIRAASLYPLESKLDPLTIGLARAALKAVRTIAQKPASVTNDSTAAFGGGSSEPYPWLSGGIR